MEEELDFFLKDELPDDQIPDVNLDHLLSESELTQEQFEILSAFSSKDFALKLLEVCEEYIGVNRSNNIEQVGRFLSLFNLGVRDGSKWMPYCAAGLSFAAAKNLCNLSGIKYNSKNAVSVFKGVLKTIRDRYFLPSPSCFRIRDHSISVNKWLTNTAANRALVKPGYLVLFKFKKHTKIPDHIGIVVSIDKDSVKTIEFNTGDVDNINGGAVARKDRPFSVIHGFVKLY